MYTMSRVKRIRHESIEMGWTTNSECTDMIVSESIRFVLPEYYPFKPPILMIGNVSHVQYLKQEYTRLFPIIQRRKYLLPCICCSSLLCSWSPCMKCNEVYQEYTRYRQQVHYIEGLEYIYPWFNDLVLDKISTFLL